MKLVRFAIKEDGEPRLGVLTPLGIADAQSCMQAWALTNGESTEDQPKTPRLLFERGPEEMERLKKAVSWSLNESAGGTVLFHPEKVRLLAPVGRPPKILCVGLNYRDHCKEQGHAIPQEPVVFAKFPTAIQNPGGPIVLPKITEQMDYEAELSVVIARGGRHIPEEKALEHVAGYMNFNDVTARDLQKRDGQWVRAKSCDTFAPCGPWLVTPDEVGDPHSLSIRCSVNGEVLQDSSTGQMIFSVRHIISFVSEFVTLEVGDIIATGTPPGVGVWREPARFLKPGDEVCIEIEKLGVLKNTVVDP